MHVWMQASCTLMNLFFFLLRYAGDVAQRSRCPQHSHFTVSPFKRTNACFNYSSAPNLPLVVTLSPAKQDDTTPDPAVRYYLQMLHLEEEVRLCGSVGPKRLFLLAVSARYPRLYSFLLCIASRVRADTARGRFLADPREGDSNVLFPLHPGRWATSTQSSSSCLREVSAASPTAACTATRAPPRPSPSPPWTGLKATVRTVLSKVWRAEIRRLLNPMSV